MNDFKLTTAMLPELIRLLKELLTSGKAYRVNVKEWREQRSLSQNSLYWQWLGVISKELKPNDQEHKPEVWHEYFKKYFCPIKLISMPAGKDVEIKSTKVLDVGEMCHYMTQIHNWAAGHMLALPVLENSDYKQNLDKQER
jgi:hypothetical protein